MAGSRCGGRCSAVPSEAPTSSDALSTEPDGRSQVTRWLWLAPVCALLLAGAVYGIVWGMMSLGAGHPPGLGEVWGRLFPRGLPPDTPLRVARPLVASLPGILIVVFLARGAWELVTLVRLVARHGRQAFHRQLVIAGLVTLPIEVAFALLLIPG